MLFKKLHKALDEAILDIDEEGVEADRFLKNLCVLQEDSDSDEECERYSKMVNAAILIMIIDIVLGFELKTWLDAAKMIFKHGR